MSAEYSREPITPERPVMKVTVYLKSGAVITFPGRYVTRNGSTGFATVPPLEIPFFAPDALAFVIQEPWTEES